MTKRHTVAVTTVRQAADNPRVIEGIAVPYGVMSADTVQVDGEVAREAFVPAAFRDDVARWSSRKDGARMAYRPQHGAKPVGTVQELGDTPEGVRFRASIFDTPAGDEYLAEVAAGLNGVSVEWGPGKAPSKRMRDGTLLHREGRLHAIAGSISPAYDGARIALRDMEEAMSTETTEQVEERDAKSATPEAAITITPEPSAAERNAAEAETLRDIRPSPARVTRAEAVYGPRSGQSYFRDLLHQTSDSAAAERLSRHQRLLTDQVELMERAGEVLSSEIPGAYAPEYLPGLLTPRILQGRPMGSFFSRVNLNSAAPRTFPQTTTSTSVTVQAGEGVNPAASDFATTAVTVTPALYGGESLVSRQVLDAADPSIDQMLMQDLTEAYAQRSETVIAAAVEAGATASAIAITLATPFAGILANIIGYQAARFAPATGVFVPPALYSTVLTQGDTTGRPLLAWNNPQNASGSIGPGGANLLGADVQLSWASTLNTVTIARNIDYVIFESPLASFRYEQGTGPAAVRIGIYAYLNVGKRSVAGGIKRVAA